MVVLTIALVPSVSLFGEGDGVRRAETTSAMESMWIEVRNPDNASRRINVVALGVDSDLPVHGVRLLPGPQHELAGGESKRVLAVFQNLRPGELREARVCYAPENLPTDRTCETFAIRRK